MANSDSLPARKEQEKSERTTYRMTFRHWGGCYTRSSRTAMPKDRWYHLENLQPIGDGNLHTVNNIGPVVHDFAGDTIYRAMYANLSGIGDCTYSFATNGKVFQTIIATGVTTQINVGNLFSGAGSMLDQWENLAVLFIDANGYYSWDGTTFTKITVSGAPAGGTAIAVYQGRVWIVGTGGTGRVVYYSVPAGENGANTGYGNNANDWNATNGSGFFILVDPQVRAGITRMISCNGYLYILSRTSINVVADVYVPQSASPPTPVFTNLNIQAIVGTDQADAVFPLDRQLIIGNRYGCYALSGTTAQKISGDIDGTWQYITLAQPLSGGQVVINNILTSAILLNQTADPELGLNTVIAMWWDGKWWFANFGALTFIFSAYAQNQPALFGFLGNKLYQLFADPTTATTTEFIGPLWDMDDAVRTKEVLKAGIELQITGTYGTVQMNLDTPNASVPIAFPALIGLIGFVNNSGNPIQFINNAGNPLYFYSPGYLLQWSGAPGGYGKYVGLSGSTTGTQYQLSGMMMDYQFAGQWAQ